MNDAPQDDIEIEPIVANAEDVVPAPGAEPPKSAALVESGDQPPSNLFILPSDSFVVFPELVAPIMLKGSLARRTIEQAATQTEFVGCLLAKPGFQGEELDPKDLHLVGCAAKVIRTLKLPDDNMSVVLRGLRRFKVKRFLRTRPYAIARVEYPEETRANTDEAQAMHRVLRGLIKRFLANEDSVPEEFKVAAANIDSPRGLADFTATYFIRDVAVRQEVLEILDVQDRLERVIAHMTREVGLIEIGKRIQEQIRNKLETQQRDFFLREQMKEIRKELGEAKDEKTIAVEKVEAQLAKLELPPDAKKRADEELERLKLLPLESPESAIIRNWLDWLVALPWNKSTLDRTDLRQAERLLAQSHFGLKDIKERILEFLAVRMLKPDHRGAILCFVGPPGVGKTSFGRAIADCLGRKFVQLSLGGLRDEAEIRGHRRTYVGALPGRILQGLKTAGANNPVFILDEIDKIGSDFRGDPSSALLEALDPEQNHRFSDNYLELPFDLSRVLFVATANTLMTIPPALQDRLEVIELAGYTASEKVGIAQRFLVPRQIERHGLKPRQVRISAPALRELVHGYTREAGVRHLDQLIARICRKVAAKVAREKSDAEAAAPAVAIEPGGLKEYLGAPRFLEDRALKTDRPGIAIGLSWTPVGGEALSVEVTRVTGSGHLNLTGMLGDVMLESARIALTYVRSQAAALGISELDMAKTDVHIHVPSGAVQKDGPSAGITMATALTSLFRNQPVRPRLAMTGELTLTGKVLPIGGLRNKVLAARRAGMTDVIVPSANRPDIDELPPEARTGLAFHFVSEYNEVAALAFPAAKARRRR